MLRTFLITAAVFVGLWLAFVLFVWLVRPDNASLSDATRLLPDTLRLVKRYRPIVPSRDQPGGGPGRC
jgi:hypothetical protein